MTRQTVFAAAALFAGVAGCILGVVLDPAAFWHAWLCAYLFWLGVPLGGVTLALVHDLTGGAWMAAARPVVVAAAATMPLATLAGIPTLLGLSAIYSWTHPDPGLVNRFYLNPAGFTLRYALDVVVWNLLAAFALWAPRGPDTPISPALSWLSGLGLILLALSTSFAAIDWIMSLEPTFWSAIFPMAIAAGWFNTGLGLVLLAVALTGPAGPRQAQMADLAAILLATTLLWAYAEFIQFLIIWEENLKTEIPWYLRRLGGIWPALALIAAALGFVGPFLALLTAPAKRRPGVVATACGVVLLGHIAVTWWLVLPEFSAGSELWPAAAAMLALGGAMVLLFLAGLRFGARLAVPALRAAASHG